MPKVPQYTKEQLEKALEDVSRGISVRAIAKKYSIPRATLHFKIKNPNTKSDFGPLPFLTTEEEKLLEEWIFDMGRRGFPRHAEDILDSVQTFLNENPRETPFHENRPGKGWLKGFLKRHPRIAERTGEAVTQASACVSESDIRNWFNLVMTELISCDLLEILDDPARIFNADESGFQTCPSSGKVFAEKGEKNVYIIDKGKAKESMTVLFTISADGQIVLPTIVYPYQRLPERIRQTVPEEWGIATSSSGWMTADTFQYILQHVFHPYLVKNNIKLPVLLFVDGHRSHLTYELSMLARSLQIEIFALYPNSTRILQPADVSLFRPVKQFWRKAVREWQLENVGEIVSKQNFALVLKKVTDKISPACIINGFRACGLYPFDPDAVDYSKCIAKTAPVTENTEESNSNNEPEKALPYSKFTDIVGSEMITKFRDIKNIIRDVQNNESFFILYRMWEFYNSKINIDIDTTATGSEDGENIEFEPEMAVSMNLEREENLKHIDGDKTATGSKEGENIESEPEMTVSMNVGREENINNIDGDSTATGSKEVENIESETEMTVSTNLERQENLNTTTMHELSGDECRKRYINDILEYENGQEKNLEQETMDEQYNNINNHQTCVNQKLNNSSNNEKSQRSLVYEHNKTVAVLHAEELISLEDLGVPVSRDCSLNQPSCSAANIKDFLKIPPTPSRKGKRNIERLPYHISGREYQKILENKIKEKQRLEEEKRQKKMERDRKREDKKRKLEEKKANKVEKKKKLETFSSTCGACKGVVKVIKLRCCECEKAFHRSCIPKSHLVHIPQEEGDNFLCHQCFHMENDDDDYDNEDGEDSDDNEDFLNKIKAREGELGVNYLKFK